MIGNLIFQRKHGNVKLFALPSSTLVFEGCWLGLRHGVKCFQAENLICCNRHHVAMGMCLGEAHEELSKNV